MKEELEKLKQELIDKMKKEQETPEPNEETMKKVHSLGSHPSAGEKKYTDKEAGYFNVIWLGIITLIMQVAFIAASYSIFK